MDASNRPKIGLALGGGGARGLAHIGVLKVFERSGIPIDFLTGTSMGGIIAGAYAAGISPAELEAEAERMTHVSSMMRLVDLSGPRRGLIEGKHIRAYLCDLLGKDTTIENLSIPLALPAVDLVSGQQVVLRQGLLVEAVQVARDFYIAELIMVAALTEIHLREARPEIIIRPYLPPGISIFWGFTRAAEAIEAGELAALHILPDLEKLLKS